MDFNFDMNDDLGIAGVGHDMGISVEVDMFYTAKYESPLGQITLVFLGETLTGLWFSDEDKVSFSPDGPVTDEAPDVYEKTVAWLDAYFGGAKPGKMPLVSAVGSSFQESVWKLVQKIPFGTTQSYEEIAQKLAETGRAASAQAVGGAVSRNPIKLLIPCHRVIASNGELTGYAGGLERKQKLLDLEKKTLGNA